MKSKKPKIKGFSLLEAIIGIFIVFIAVSSLSTLFIDLSRVTGKSKMTKQMASLAKQVIEETLYSAYTTSGYNNIQETSTMCGAVYCPGSLLLATIQSADPALLDAIQFRQEIMCRNLDDFTTNVPCGATEDLKRVRFSLRGPYSIDFTTVFFVPKP